tara:strand:- start:3320 stop:3823 length:504 start_codon:yes stop_codon:yes gene_type:complete
MIKLKKVNNTEKTIVIKKWVKWINDKIVTQFSEQRLKKHTVKSQKKFIQNKLHSNSSYIYKVIYNNDFIGILEIGNINYYHKNCELMYMIGEKNLWSKGIGEILIKKGIKLAKALNMKKIYAGTYGGNIASQKVLLKNKFKIEGRIKKFFKIKKKRDDRVLLGLNIK